MKKGLATPGAPRAAGDAEANISRLVGHQLRGVRHSCEKARTLLGYEPLISFSEGMEHFRRWYIAYHGYNSADWPLLRELYPHAAF